MNIEVSNRPSGPVGYQPVEFLDIPPMHESRRISSEPTSGSVRATTTRELSSDS